MNEFEDELRSALRPQQPRPGFTGRVLARTGSRAAPWHTGWMAAGIAALLLLSAGGFEYHQYQGRKAKKELLVALQIAGSKLSFAQKKILDLSQRTIHD